MKKRKRKMMMKSVYLNAKTVMDIIKLQSDKHNCVAKPHVYLERISQDIISFCMFGFVCVFCCSFRLFFSFWRCVHFFTWFVRIIIKDGTNSSERTKRVRAIIIERVFVDFALVASCTRNHNQKLPEKHFRGYICYGPGIFFVLRSCRFKFRFFSRFILLCAASLHLIKMKMYKTS